MYLNMSQNFHLNKLEALWAEPVSFTFHTALRNTEPSIGASHQVSVNFGEAVSEKKIFLEINQQETRIAYGSHVCKQIGMELAVFIEDLP